MPPTCAADVNERGARVCRRVTRAYARTFYVSSACLPRTTRAHAYAIYGFCRWADNAVDDASGPDEAIARLNFARSALEDAYGRSHVAPGLSAFRRAVRDRSIPKALFDDLLDGMEMDLTVRRYANFGELDLYCYRVAGVVGLMMTHLFGFRDDRCFPQALSLGTAMQLTNILRDIGEDSAMGRIYLPQDEMSQFGVTEEQVGNGLVDDRFRSLMRFQIDRARRYYAEAEEGIAWLVGPSSRLTVRVMGRLYGGILGAIERQDFEVFRSRARVSGARKLVTLAACQAEGWADAARRFWL